MTIISLAAANSMPRTMPLFHLAVFVCVCVCMRLVVPCPVLTGPGPLGGKVYETKSDMRTHNKQIKKKKDE